MTLQNAIDLNGANRTIAVNGNTAVISSVLSNSTGTAGLTKIGAGTLNLTNANTFNGDLIVSAGALNITATNAYAGATTVNGGTLTLSYTGTSTGANFVPNTTSLALNGGTFRVVGTGGTAQSTSQTVPSVSPLLYGSSGIAAVTTASRPVVINLGAITRNAGGGFVNFTLPSGTQDATNGITTTTGGSAGKIGVWATVGNDWAAKSGDNIVAFTGYTDLTRLSSGSKTIISSAGSDVRVIDGTGAAGDITPAATGTTDIGTLLVSATGGTTTYNPGASDVLRLGAAGGVLLTGTSGTGALVIGTTSGDGILTAGGADNTAGTIAFINNRTDANYRITVNSNITNNGTGTVTLEKGGASHLILAGTNTFSGGVTIASGTVYASGGTNNTQVLGTGRLTINGGIFSLHTSDGQNPGNQTVGSIAGSGGSIRAGGRTLTFGGDNTDSTYLGSWDGGTFTKVGTGTTTVFGPNSTLTSVTAVNVYGGTLRLGAARDLASVTISSTGANYGGTLDLNGYNSTFSLSGLNAGGAMSTGAGIFTNLNAMQRMSYAGTATFTGNWVMPANPTFRLDANSVLVIDGVLSGGAGNITADGNMQSSGIVRLSGSAPNTFTGTWAMSKGMTELSKSNGVAAIPTTVNLTGGTLMWRANEQIADTAALVTAGGEFNLNGFNETATSLSSPGSGQFTTSCSGLLTLTASSGDIISIGTGWNITKEFGFNIALTGSGGGILMTSATNQNRTMRIGSSTTGERTLDLGTVARTINVVGNSSDGGLPGGIEANISSRITGAGGIIKAGVGNLQLSATNTFTGDTRVDGGTLNLGSNLALQNSVLDTSGTGTVTLNGGVTAPTFGGLKGSTNLASMITSYTGVTMLTLNPGGVAAPTYSGVIANGSANMTVKKTGLGTQVLAGSNTYSGGTAINGGVLAVTANNNLGAVGGPLTIDGGTLQIGGGSAFETDRNTTLDAGGATLDIINSSSGGVLFTGILSGSGNLTKSGSGLLTLEGDSTNSGTTTVTAGMLVLANATGSATGTGPVVVTGGVLAGTGTAAGNLTINAGGTVAPGLSIGTLGVGGSLTLAGTSDFEIDVTSLTSDRIIGITDLVYGGALKITNSTGAFATGNSWDLFDITGSTSGAFTNTFGNSGDGTLLPTLSGNLVWQFDYNTGVLSIGTTGGGGGNNSVLGASTASVNLGRMMTGNLNSSVVTIGRLSGTSSTGFSTSTSGAATVLSATNSAPGSISGSQSGSLTASIADSLGTGSGTISVLNSGDNGSGPSNAGAGTGNLQAAIDIAVSGTVVNNRTVTSTSASFGLVRVGQALSQGITLSTTGSDSEYTRVTVANGGPDVNGFSVAGGLNPTFNGAAVTDSRTLSGTASLAGPLSGLITLLTGSEGLTGESPINVNVSYTAQVFSGSGVWNSSSGSLWATHGNWTSAEGVAAAPGTFGAPYHNTDTATFSGSGTVTSVSLSGADPSLAALVFSGTDYTLSGGSLTLAKTGTDSPVIAVSDSTTQTISSEILGTQGLLKSGSGTLVLSGTNSFTGGTTVADGTLVLTTAGALLDGSSLTVGDASAFLAPVVPPPPAAPVPGAPVSPVPEPGTLGLLLACLAGAAVYRTVRRRCDA